MTKRRKPAPGEIPRSLEMCPFPRMHVLAPLRPPPLPEPETFEEALAQRNELLAQRDWLVARVNKLEWFRAQRREGNRVSGGSGPPHAEGLRRRLDELVAEYPDAGAKDLAKRLADTQVTFERGAEVVTVEFEVKWNKERPKQLIEVVMHVSRRERAKTGKKGKEQTTDPSIGYTRFREYVAEAKKRARGEEEEGPAPPWSVRRAIEDLERQMEEMGREGGR